MKYLIRDPATKVINLQFESPIIPSQGIEVIEVPDAQYKTKMLGSIFQSVNIYKPYPSEGDYWVSDGTNWIDPRTDDEIWEQARKIRDEALIDSDWTQLADADLTQGEINQWANYRATIRDAVANAADSRDAVDTIKNAETNRPDRNNTDPRRGRGRGRK